MKIVLIRPQFVNKKISFFAYRDPTALAGICSYLQSKEYDVSLWDYQDIDYDNYGFKHAVLTCCPAVVGFSCLTPNILIANDMARIVKSINPEIVTVVGGCHSTAIPMQTLKECLYFDIAIIGEGEITFEELCKKIQNHENYKNMAGIAYRDKDKIVINPSRELIKDIDILPYPARYLYQDNKKRYQHFGRGISHDIHVTDIFTARGCPNKCTFCAGNLSMKNSGISYRQHSVSYVLGEVEECIKRYYYDHLSIMDDTFTIHKKRVYEICAGIRKLGLKSFDCQARVNTVDKELITELVKSGCKKISFGVESGSQRILDLIHKNITIDQARAAFKLARDCRLEIAEGTFMIGQHPTESIDDIKKTISLMKELKPDYVSVSILVPYPGTEIYKEMQMKKYITSYDWNKYIMLSELPQWHTDYFGPEQLVKIHRKVALAYCLSLGYIFMRLKKLKSIQELKYLVRSAYDLFKHIVMVR